MLTELRIENFAIIEKLVLHFEHGLVIFTGETGAGKSIIIDAMETVLGGRAETNQVRSGADYALVEAVFRIPQENREAICALLEREALLENDEYLTLAREIRPGGRNLARVNGRTVSVSLQRELGEFLVDVHGQSEHLSLLRVAQHLHLLDRYGMIEPSIKLQEALERYQSSYRQWNAIHKELNELRKAEREAARRQDILGFQIREIESAHLKLGEEETLLAERNRLANAEALASLTQEAITALDEGSPQTPSALDLLGQVSESLEKLSRLDESQRKLAEAMQSAFESLTDLVRELRHYQENIEFNPKRLDQVEERLNLISTLKKKYGETIPLVLEFCQKMRQELEMITHASERIAELEEKEKEIRNQLLLFGEELSQKRRRAALSLAKAIEEELEHLHMPSARFEVSFERQSDENGLETAEGTRIAFYPNGLERIEFLIAPNPGEGFKPLAKIASGGETSRLMLALKNVLAQADDIPTLIFDEIDQGIGGRVGTIVGQKLWKLGRKHQVLCITHLPQLAAFGEQHFHVEKRVQNERTVTLVRQLEGEERLIELAQMLGNLSEGTLQSAAELVQIVQRETTQT